MYGVREGKGGVARFLQGMTEEGGEEVKPSLSEKLFKVGKKY